MMWGRHGLHRGMGVATHLIAGAYACLTLPQTDLHPPIQTTPHYDEALNRSRPARLSWSAGWRSSSACCCRSSASCSPSTARRLLVLRPGLRVGHRAWLRPAAGGFQRPTRSRWSAPARAGRRDCGRAADVEQLLTTARFAPVTEPAGSVVAELASAILVALETYDMTG